MESKKGLSESQLITRVIFGAVLAVSFIYALVSREGVYLMLSSSFIGASGTFFLHDVCFPPGKIFGAWIPFLEKYFRDNLRNPFRFLGNPLGLCAYCQNTWISLFTFIAFEYNFDFSWWLLLPSLFVSHLMLNVLDKTFWQE